MFFVEDLKANILLGIDAMGLEGFDVVNLKGYVDIDSCCV